MLLCSIDIGAKGWREIVPLVSSRTEVEQKLGAPKSRGKFVSLYEFADEFVEIYYASGSPCGSGLVNVWKVRRDVVVSVRVSPKQEPGFARIVTDTTGYLKTSDPINRSLVYYFNEEEGIRYTVRVDAQSSSQTIMSIDYLPEHSQYHLKCPAIAPAVVGVAPFEKYRYTSADRQKAILDNFAIQLENENPLTGLIVIYSTNNKRASEAAAGVRNYLINSRGIDPKRLAVKTAKQQTDLFVELYLLPPNKDLRDREE